MSCRNSEIHINNIGTTFQVTIQDCDGIVNISSATITFIFLKPNGTQLTKTGSFYTDGSDGITQYTTIDGDLDIAGVWKLQVLVQFASSSFKTNIYTFNVYRNL